MGRPSPSAYEAIPLFQNNMLQKPRKKFSSDIFLQNFSLSAKISDDIF